MSEEILDSNTRNAILSKVAGLGKREPQPIQESRTPGVQVTETLDLSTAPKKWVSSETKASEGTKVLNEVKNKPSFCQYCGQKLPESGKTEMVQIAPVRESKSVGFDSSTPADVLLEACLTKRAEQEEEIRTVGDEVRKQIIEKVNKPEDCSFLKDWKF